MASGESERWEVAVSGREVAEMMQGKVKGMREKKGQ